jgi:hypothetical protein
MEERTLIWRVAANIPKKQSRTAERGDPLAWGLSEVLTTLHCKNMLLRDTHTVRVHTIKNIVNIYMYIYIYIYIYRSG